jgi:hypothetical protein
MKYLLMGLTSLSAIAVFSLPINAQSIIEQQYVEDFIINLAINDGKAACHISKFAKTQGELEMFVAGTHTAEQNELINMLMDLPDENYYKRLYFLYLEREMMPCQDKILNLINQSK